MPMSRVIGRWLEISPTMLGPKRSDDDLWEIFLPATSVTVCRRPSGNVWLNRLIAVETIWGASREEVDRKLIEYFERPDVRLLRKGVSIQDFKRLPIRQEQPPPAVLDGSASIYTDKLTLTASACEGRR